MPQQVQSLEKDVVVVESVEEEEEFYILDCLLASEIIHRRRSIDRGVIGRSFILLLDCDRLERRLL